MKKHGLLMGLIALVGFTMGCATGQSVHTKEKAVAGSLIGAAAGGIIGHQSGRGLEGAAIGAAAGGVGGAVLGSAQDEEESQDSDF